MQIKSVVLSNLKTKKSPQGFNHDNVGETVILNKNAGFNKDIALVQAIKKKIAGIDAKVMLMNNK